ncbi:hypothetical protein [Clostridium sp. UBA1056]|uniref:hypothetical protein n=1 Tax=unclassified Clostridium TaxID=2614128 RepID=UPI003217B597
MPHRGEAYDIVQGVCSVGLVAVCAIGITIIVADDFLVVPLGSGIGKGMTIILGG